MKQKCDADMMDWFSKMIMMDLQFTNQHILLNISVDKSKEICYNSVR